MLLIFPCIKHKKCSEEKFEFQLSEFWTRNYAIPFTRGFPTVRHLLKIKNNHYRGSHPEAFCRKGVTKIFWKFIGTHLCRSLFSTKMQACTKLLIIKQASTIVLFCQFWNFQELLFHWTPFSDCFWDTGLMSWMLPKLTTNSVPNKHLLVPSQQWKHQNNVWNLSKGNNKDRQKTSLASLWYFLVF